MHVRDNMSVFSYPSTYSKNDCSVTGTKGSVFKISDSDNLSAASRSKFGHSVSFSSAFLQFSSQAYNGPSFLGTNFIIYMYSLKFHIFNVVETFISSSSSSSVICQTTGPKPLPKRFLHRVSKML